METQCQAVCLCIAESQAWSSDMASYEGLVLYLLAMALLHSGHRPSGDNGGTQCRQKKNSIRAISTEYHISDRNDGHDNDDGTTRTYPSRTSFGAAYSLAEKHPFLLERHFGIKAFDYWWGYSACQIELMIIDMPMIDYNFKKNSGKKSMIATKAEEEEMDALQKAWDNKRNGRSFVGKTVNLNEFVQDKI